MEQPRAFSDRLSMPTNPPAQDFNNGFPHNDYLPSVAMTASQHNQATVPIVLFPLGFLAIGSGLAAILWLALHGPALVPGQDTRITAIMISAGSRLAGLFMGAAIIRSAWAAFLPRVLAGEPIPTQALVGACQNFMSLGQLGNYGSLPSAFKFHIALAAFITLAMVGTSASFRYDSIAVVGNNFASVPDVASICNPSLVNGSNYFCNGAVNANTTETSWSYLEDVYNGGQGTVYRYGELGDQELGANVTLGVLPAGWALGDGSDLPWMAIWVACQPLSISAEFLGSGLEASTDIYVNDTFLDTLDIANMPEWGSVVHLYQQVNESVPASSLCPWKVVMLARDLDDGTANFGGLAPDAVTYLGNSYLDLHGYGPIVQGVLGAAAWCQFNGSTGGQWPDEFWPPLNYTTNVVIGTVVNDRPTMATALLNYGPSWQYNPVSENSLPGGSVSYIANNTGPGVSFPALFSSYIRNQWTLMAYSIAPQSGQQISLSFAGSGPNKLFISVTILIVLPSSALVIGLLMIIRAWLCTIRQRHWVNRVEFESWWLAKALRPDVYRAGYCNATEKKFYEACEGFSTSYRDLRPNSNVGHLALYSTRQNDIPAGIPLSKDIERLYG
jgi:hypothetical protein